VTATAPEPPRWLIGLVLGGAVILFVVGWVGLAVLSALACDGDGGVPYAAPGSTVSALCHAREGGFVEAAFTAGLALAPVALFAGGIAAVLRRSWVLLAAVVGGSVALLLAVTLPFLVLPS
jgi:hypothetical protein